MLIRPFLGGWGQLLAYLNVICFLIMFTQFKVRAVHHNSSCTASEEYRRGLVDGQQVCVQCTNTPISQMRKGNQDYLQRARNMLSDSLPLTQTSATIGRTFCFIFFIKSQLK